MEGIQTGMVRGGGVTIYRERERAELKDDYVENMQFSLIKFHPCKIRWMYVCTLIALYE